MRTLKVALLLLVTLFITTTASAQIPLSPQANITLITCGPGNELYSVFGHTAVRVHDPAANLDVVYNFGTFDFSTPNFYLKFVKGDLQYFVSASSYEDFVYTYQYYNRDVLEQQLNLSPTQKQQIYNELTTTLNSDKRFYTYKFFDRNCTTMVGDIFTRYIPGGISMKNDDAGKTNREIIYERLNSSFYENLGISLIFGHKTDMEQYKLFLPNQLLQGVANTKTTTGPLAQPTVTAYKAIGSESISVWNNFYTWIIICLALMYFSRNIVVQRSLIAVFGLLGVFFTFVGLYSYHQEIALNYNALLINPLFLLLIFFIFLGRYTAVKTTIYVCFACMALYLVIVITKPYFLIVLPLIALVAILLMRALNANTKKRLHNA
ncbi:DUF4105 domain-containing protein [Flavobacterium zepuense]|uniref:DUF4105 domain-containing protein n=1 Tax=Flavobacterium zepuense TaxID=2593302 RepID=A0A552V2H0_9FLAO|nr:DUF4105 domain-containing protein [Flavobacterium zepuense]TRW24651.1 DUF4105 domain-containing protein [Flavobacterium zepuense]